jgi:hypothetical protein
VGFVAGVAQCGAGGGHGGAVEGGLGIAAGLEGEVGVVAVDLVAGQGEAHGVGAVDAGVDAVGVEGEA